MSWILFLCLALAPVSSPQRQAPSRIVPDEVVVCVPRARDRRGVEARFASEGMRVLEELPALSLLRVRLRPDAPMETALARLKATPGVAFAEPNGEGEPGFLPNDTFFTEQWHLENRGQDDGIPGADIEAVPGWDLARGSANVIVAVLDTGLILDHPDFAGRLLPGHDFVQDDDDPTDLTGHGTAVTSILAANADNAFGLAGVDHRCLVLPVRVLASRGSVFDLVQGLTFAADAGADIINISLINYPDNATLRAGLAYARDAGCILIACAGNNGAGNADVSMPGASPLTISVGFTTRRDRLAALSGTGAHLDLVAPGQAIPALVPNRSGNWDTFSGCSASTPIVSGIAALALSIDPYLTHEEMRALLAQGAEDQVGAPAIDPPGRDDGYGEGRVNLFRTLCGLDAGAPAILGPEPLVLECPVPNGLAGDDPLVADLLTRVTALDDLDPRPVLTHEAPAFLALGSPTPVRFTARDSCGHVGERLLSVVLVDTRAPELELRLGLESLLLTDDILPVSLQARTRDACDLEPSLVLRVASDEPEAVRGEPDAALDRRGALSLRGRRDPLGDGRVYLCWVESTDDFANAVRQSAVVVVPRDGDAASLALVQAQAASAKATLDTTGAPPVGFHRLLEEPLPKSSAPLGR